MQENQSNAKTLMPESRGQVVKEMGVPAHFSHGMVLLDGTPPDEGVPAQFTFLWFSLHITMV